MSSDPVPVNVHILDKEYMVSCPAEERDALVESARYLDERMREVRDSGKVLGTERIAVIAALNIVNEFLQHQREEEQLTDSVDRALRSLEERIGAAIGRRPHGEAVD